MDTLAIKEFISIYQYAVFCQVRATFDSLVPNEKDFPEILIKYNRSITNIDEYNSGVFVQLLENSNLVDVVQVLPQFQFIKPLYLDTRFVIFGRDSDTRVDFGVDLVNRNVIMFDYVEGAYTYIADSENGFLGYLRYYIEYMIIPNEIKNKYEVSMMFRKKVITAVGGDKYADYYNYIFTIEGCTTSNTLKFPYKL